MNTTTCSSCGQTLAANQKFCANCGQAATTNATQTATATATQTQAQTAPAVAAPPSLLMLLFAHNFIPAAGMLGAGAVAPCQPSVKVNAHELVNQMMAAAFWNLHRQQFISIEIGAKEGWIFKSTPVHVRLLRHETQSGLEHDFLETLRVRQTASTVEQTIMDFLQVDRPNPTQVMLDRAVEWAIHLGYGSLANKRGMFKPSELNFEQNCQLINSLEAAARAFQTEWQQFQTQDAALYKEIIKDCQDAIGKRKEVELNDSSYSDD